MSTKTVTKPLCAAYLKSGVRCLKPATFVHPGLSGLVCADHRPAPSPKSKPEPKP